MPDNERKIAAGADLGGTKVLAALVDEEGRISRKAAGPSGPGLEAVVAALEKVIQHRQPDAIGLAVAGWISEPDKRVVFAPNLDGLPSHGDVVAQIEGNFGLPVRVENDANAAAWAEWRFGAGAGSDTMLMLTLGTGVGGGAVLDGKLYRGARGFASEFGHMTLDDEGPTCACGGCGCLEALVSGTAIGRMAAEAVGDHPGSSVLRLADGDVTKINGAMVADAAEAGDELAVQILERAGYWLGVGLANLAMIFDPQVIVVGGGAADSGDLILGPARREMDRRYRSRFAPPRVEHARMGNDAGVIGAAVIAMG